MVNPVIFTSAIYSAIRQVSVLHPLAYSD